MKRFLKGIQTDSQALADDALSFTTTFGNKPFRIESIMVSFDVAVTETITITLDSKSGSTYDVQLRTYDMVSEQYFRWIPDGDVEFLAGDQIKIQCTNSNLTGTAYVEVRAGEVKG